MVAAEDDADKDSVVITVRKFQYAYVTILDDDTDLIVLILQHAEKSRCRITATVNTLFYYPKSEMWNMKEVISKIRLKSLPFLPSIFVAHVFFGCDTRTHTRTHPQNKAVHFGSSIPHPQNKAVHFGSSWIVNTFFEANKTPATDIM